MPVSTTPRLAIQMSVSRADGSGGFPAIRSAKMKQAGSTAFPPKMSDIASCVSPARTGASPVLSSGSEVAAARIVAPNTGPPRPARPASSSPARSITNPATSVTAAAAPKISATVVVPCCRCGFGSSPPALRVTASGPGTLSLGLPAQVLAATRDDPQAREPDEDDRDRPVADAGYLGAGRQLRRHDRHDRDHGDERALEHEH